LTVGITGILDLKLNIVVNFNLNLLWKYTTSTCVSKPT